MRNYTSNQDLYNHIDEVVTELRANGFQQNANQIQALLHETAWTSTSELFGELRNEFQRLLISPKPLSQPARESLKDFIATIDRAFDRANGIP